MQLMMFSVPALNPGASVEEMNSFLRSHRVLSVDRRLVGTDGVADGEAHGLRVTCHRFPLAKLAEPYLFPAGLSPFLG